MGQPATSPVSTRFRVARWFAILTAFLTAVAGELAASLASWPEPPQSATVRVSTELVVVDTLVERKKDGLPIRSLGPDDFEIYEDGVLQPITQFGLDNAPLSIVFLFDMTDSVRPVLERLARGALTALGHLKADDEIAVMLYASRADLIQGFTKDHDRVARAIELAGAMRPGHCGREPELCGLEAYFNEAIYQAATVAEETRTPGSRPVIIWLTDNVPNIPPDTVHSEADALSLLRLTGVGVSVLLEHSGQSLAAAALYSKNPMLAFNRQRHPPGDVGTYTREAGGLSINAGRDDVSGKLGDLIDRIRSRYTIGYRPLVTKAEGVVCRIDVRLSRAALRREGAVEIRARRSYRR